jgi:predicted dehydrogenase
MAARLRVGVIGLGRRWGRYRRALTARGSVRVRAVCDSSVAHAERQAAELGCQAAGGVMELVERADIDAVLVLDPGWQGLWPVEQAVRAGKHVLCASLSPHEVERIEPLCRRPQEDGPRVVMAAAPRLWRLVVQVWFLLERRLGPVRLVRLHWTGSNQGHRPALEAPILVPLLLACRELFEVDPEVVRAVGLPGTPGQGTVLLGFPDGRAAEVSVWRGPAMRTSCRLEFIAEGGGGVAELPADLRWQDAEGRHHRRLPAGLPEAEVLERFAGGILGKTDPGPTLADVEAALGWLRRARESMAGK